MVLQCVGWSLSWLQGLRPDTIFGCLYEYLFEPLPEVKEMFRTQLAVMQDNMLKIAIQVRYLRQTLVYAMSWCEYMLWVQQIRTGDEAMVARSPDGPDGALSELLRQWRAYFMCAQVQCLDLHHA